MWVLPFSVPTKSHLDLTAVDMVERRSRLNLSCCNSSTELFFTCQGVVKHLKNCGAHLPQVDGVIAAEGEEAPCVGQPEQLDDHTGEQIISGLKEDIFVSRDVQEKVFGSPFKLDFQRLVLSC